MRSGVRPPLSADELTSALVRDYVRLADALGPGSVTKALGDAALVLTGVPIPMLNGVVTVRTTSRAVDVASLLDEASRSGLRYSIQIRPGCGSEVSEAARAIGMIEQEQVPLMAAQADSESLVKAADHAELSVRVIEPREASQHCLLAAEGFDVPVEIFQRLVTPCSPSRAFAPMSGRWMAPP